MRVDGKFLAVNGKSIFDGIFTAVTQHDGKFLAVDGFPFFDGNFLAVDGNSNLDGKSPLYRDRPPVRYFYVGKFTEHFPGIFQFGNIIRIFWGNDGSIAQPGAVAKNAGEHCCCVLIADNRTKRRLHCRVPCRGIDSRMRRTQQPCGVQPISRALGFT